MVSDKEIKASNALINDATAPRVAVFIGATSGIGKFTVRALADTGASTRIYLVGRKSSAERMNLFMQELHAFNPKVEFNWIEAEVALLSETKRVCEVIKSRESRVDLLFLTTGYAPFGPRKETAEGIEKAQSLIVDFVSTPDIRSKLGGKTTISERITRCWLEKLEWWFTKKANGMYIDGHE